MINEILRMERVTFVDKGITKLEDFNFRVNEGEIVGLIPVNAYGLEDLLALFQTNLPLYDGYIYYGGELVNSWRGHIRSQNRICTIRARSCLVERMTVADNIFVLRQGFRQEIIPSAMLKKQLAPYIEELGIDIQADTYVEKLSAFERVVVEILRAVVMGQRLIILDEISTLISETKLAKLYEIVRFYASQGFSFIYIDLHFEGIQQICDRAVLFTNGRVQKVIRKPEMQKDILIQYIEEYRNQMVYPEVEKKRELIKKGKPVLFENILYGSMKSPISMVIEPGECLLMQCLDNTTYSELKKVLMGDVRTRLGSILVDGKQEIKPSDIMVIQEEPTTTMIFPELSYYDNLSMGLVQKVSRVCFSRKVRASIMQEYKEYIGEGLYHTPIDALTEKEKYQLVYMRALLQRPKVVFCIQPFKGADLAHRRYIWELLELLMSHGISVVIISVNRTDSLMRTHRLVRISRNGMEEISKDSL